MANPEHVAILKQGVEVWNKWRKDNPDIKPDLRRVDLQEADLRGISLAKSKLKYANLSKANMSDAFLGDADLFGANLEETNFSNAYFYSANLECTKLKNTNFKGANLSKANLSGVDLSNVNLNNVELQDSNLRDTNLCGVDLSKVDLIYANLNKANLTNAKLCDADLLEATLGDANLEGADCRGANFYQASLLRAKLISARFDGAYLSEVDLREAYIFETNLSDADLSEANCIDAEFEEASLTGACIGGWNIHQATFDRVSCDYIFLESDWDKDLKKNVFSIRRPQSGIFKPGEFEILIREMQNTVDLIFAKGVNWQALLTTLRQARATNPQADINVQDISHKGGGAYLIKFGVSQEIDPAKLHHELTTGYEHHLARLSAHMEQQSQHLEQMMEMMALKQRTQFIDTLDIGQYTPSNDPAKLTDDHALYLDLVSRLRKQKIIQNDPTLIFQIDHQLAQAENALRHIEERLMTLEKGIEDADFEVEE